MITVFQGMDPFAKIQATRIGLPVGNNKSKVYQYTTNVTAPIAFVMDVNGKKGPNSETIDNKYYDIRSFGGAGFAQSGPPMECYNDTCIYYVGTAYTSIDCSDSSNPLYSYCYPTPSGESNDYWAGAKYKCDQMNLDLPTIAQLRSIYSVKSNFPSIASYTRKFWSSEEFISSNYNRGHIVSFYGYANSSTNDKNEQNPVLCIGR